MDEIGVRELEARLSAVLQRVSGGEQVRVTVRGRPVADIVLAGASPADDALRSLIVRGGSSLLHERGRRGRRGWRAPVGSASALVLAEREDER
jgi:prevent-host-death family protein